MSVQSDDDFDECDVFLKTVLVEKISISPKYQNKHLKESIAILLQNKVEGTCSKWGYIQPNSVEVTSISDGVLDTTAMNGSFIYEVRFKASVCNPPVGALVKCKVENINTYGISAVNMSRYRVLEIIVPKDMNDDDEIDMNKIQIGSIIVIKVLRKKYDLLQSTITVIASIVSHDEDAYISAPMVDNDLLVEDEAGDTDVKTIDITDEEEEEEEEDGEADIEEELEGVEDEIEADEEEVGEELDDDDEDDDIDDDPEDEDPEDEDEV
jgi:DNA-directed RNA polymerase subunit E'/Rpb7